MDILKCNKLRGRGGGGEGVVCGSPLDKEILIAMFSPQLHYFEIRHDRMPESKFED